MPMNVVVVEAHQHLLEHIHYILRCNARKAKGSQPLSWGMLHWDSHPDLACPNEGIPAGACFMPRKEWRRSKKDVIHAAEIDEGKNLYDMLDTSQGGIAEWILPLVLAGGLERVIWVKNNYCKQFEKGQYSYQVGVLTPDSDNGNEGETAYIDSFLDLPEGSVVKTSLSHPYYIDDNSYIQEDLLLLKKHFELSVLEADETMNAGFPASAGVDAEKADWILDVCLDYFFCNNPFVDDLRNLSEGICNLFTKALTNVTFRKEVEGMKSLSTQRANRYAQSQEDFHGCVRSLLQKVGCLAIGTEFNFATFDEAGEMDRYYTDASEGIRCWTDLLEQMSDYCTKECFPIANLISIMINALPNISLPSEYDDCKLEKDLLPTSLQMKVKVFGDCLRQRRWMSDKFKDEPMMVTVARSADDGYTPNDIVEPLQNMVLKEVHSVYCGCAYSNNGLAGKDCKLNIVLDFGKYEGSSLEELYLVGT